MPFAAGRLIFAFLILTAGLCVPASEQQCKVSIDGVVDISFDMLKQKMITKTVFEYKRVQNGNVVSIYDLSDTVKITVDGKLMNESVIDRNGMTLTDADGTKSFKTLDLPADRQKDYTDRFDVPVVVHHLDADGKIEKTDPPKSEGAKLAQKIGTSANLQLFHGCFMMKKNVWSELTGMGGGDGPSLGALRYEKQPSPADKPHLVPVKVSGELLSEQTFAGGHKMTIINKVTGEQVYDMEQKKYVSGKLEMSVQSQPAPGTKASMNGNIVVTMVEVKPTEAAEASK